MFWYVPSWLEYLNVWKVLTISAYVLAFALVESLFMVGLLVLFSLLFPRHLFKDQFIQQGSSLAALTSISAVLLQRKINLVYRLESWQILVYPLIFLVALGLLVWLLAFLFERIPFLKYIIAALAERMTAFLYLYVPLGAVGLIVVLVRNILQLS